MSKYPVPIFQPTIPHDCQSNPAWLEQIHAWMSLQMERHEAFRRQLETQNHLLLQLNRRLDRVFLKLATLEPDPASQAPLQGPATPCPAGSMAWDEPEANRLPNCAKCGRTGPSEACGLNDSPHETPARSGLGPEKRPHQGVSSWMQQREVMLKCLVAQLEIEDSLYPVEIDTGEVQAAEGMTASPEMTPPTTPSESSHEELIEIDGLKEELRAAIREMEVECSVQRAKLSHERARLESREAELQRREKKLVRDSREKLIAEEKAEPLVSRIKGLLKKS
ncbi:MAG: hypothetical protein ACK493_12075 [Planctomycetota bacterium]|jgi:hypothetical protein|nr:hypothetical protein [Blastopirellula sp.]